MVAHGVTIALGHLGRVLRDVAPVTVTLLVAATAGAVQPTDASRAPASSAAEIDLDRLVDQFNRDEDLLAQKLSTIGPSLEVVHRRMIARGRVYYRHVRAGLLPASGGFDALVDHAARVERARLALERDLAAEADLKRKRSDLERKISRIRLERAPLDVQREAMTRARAALAEVDERHAAFARAFETSSRPGDYVAIYGADPGPRDGETAGAFVALKGRLPFPVAGRAEVHHVTRPHVGGPGIELAGARGTPVRSVAPGRVVFADRYDDYGLTALLDHGDHYYSLYANLDAVDVRMGETVAAGARLGTMGEGPKHGLLYFELRHGTEVIDPSAWLGL